MSSTTTTGCSWSSSASSVGSIGATGIVTGLTGGTTTISYTHSAGCARSVVVSVLATAPAITGNLNLCVGGAVQLSNTISGGTWTTSAATIATVTTLGKVTGIAAGTARITYTILGGCRSISIVTVAASPAAITGATSVLLGTTTIFAHPTTGGTWSCSNPSQAFVDPSLGNISGLALGTPTITYTISEGCFKTKAISVVDTGAVIGGVKTLCVSSTTPLSCPGYAGVTWSSNNTSVATIGATSGVVTGISVGTAVITFTSSTVLSTTVVTVMPLPTAITTTASTICQYTTATLTSAGTTGGTWVSSQLAIGTVGFATGIVMGRAGGSTILTYTWTNGCKRTTTISVSPLPLSAAIVGAGTMSPTTAPVQTLTASRLGGTWSSADLTKATMTALAAGNVTISYTQTNGCGSITNTRIFTIYAPRVGSPVNGSENVAAEFALYPNPTSRTFTIATAVTGKFTVLSMDGRVVMVNNITDSKTTLSMPNDLAAGTYVCRFNGDDGSTTMVRLVYEP